MQSFIKKESEEQARNQIGTPGGAKSFPSGAQIFWTMSNIFKLCPTYFSRRGNLSTGVSPPCSPPGYGPAEETKKMALIFKKETI